MIIVIQLNRNQSIAAHDMLEQTATEAEIDLLMISEPNERLVDGNKSWYMNISMVAAIRILNRNRIKVRKHGESEGFVWIVANGLLLISCHFSPNRCLRDFERMLEGGPDIK